MDQPALEEVKEAIAREEYLRDCVVREYRRCYVTGVLATFAPLGHHSIEWELIRVYPPEIVKVCIGLDDWYYDHVEVVRKRIRVKMRAAMQYLAGGY